MIITVTALICMICSRELLHFNYTDRFIGTYIFYFILGMFFAKNRDNVLKKSYCAINIAGFIITSVIYLIYLYKASVGEVSYRFENILNIIYVSFSIMALYTVYSSLSEKCSILYNISKYLSAVSYNIYLYHIFVMSILKYDIMTRFNLSARVEFLVTFIVLYFIIFIYLAVDSRIRNRLNSWQRYMKMV